MTGILIVITILLGTVAVTGLVIAADRSARATAWRQIAKERRWNHEQRR